MRPRARLTARQRWNGTAPRNRNLMDEKRRIVRVVVVAFPPSDAGDSRKRKGRGGGRRARTLWVSASLRPGQAENGALEEEGRRRDAGSCCVACSSRGRAASCLLVFTFDDA